MSTCRASCATAFRPEPERTRQHVRLEDRLEHDLHRGLHDPVPNRRNRQRPLLRRTRLRDKTRRAGSGRYRPCLSSSANSSSSRDTPYSSTSAMVTRSMPGAPRWRAPHPTPATGHLCGRSCPPARETVARDRPWPPGTAHAARHEPDPQGDPEAAGLAETALTGHLQDSITHRRSSGPSLTGGCVVRSAQAVLRPPPTPTRHTTHFPEYRL